MMSYSQNPASHWTGNEENWDDEGDQSYNIRPTHNIHKNCNYSHDSHNSNNQHDVFGLRQKSILRDSSLHPNASSCFSPGFLGICNNSTPLPDSLLSPDRYGFYHPIVDDLRERGLLNAVEGDPSNDFSRHQNEYHFSEHKWANGQQEVSCGRTMVKIETTGALSSSTHFAQTNINSIRSPVQPSPVQPSPMQPLEVQQPSSLQQQQPSTCPKRSQPVSRDYQPSTMLEQPPPSLGRGRFWSNTSHEAPKRTFGRGQTFAFRDGRDVVRGVEGEANVVGDALEPVITDNGQWDDADSDSGTISADSGSDSSGTVTTGFSGRTVGTESSRSDGVEHVKVQPKKKALTPYQTAIKENFAKLQLK